MKKRKFGITLMFNDKKDIEYNVIAFSQTEALDNAYEANKFIPGFRMVRCSYAYWYYKEDLIKNGKITTKTKHVKPTKVNSTNNVVKELKEESTDILMAKILGEDTDVDLD